MESDLEQARLLVNRLFERQSSLQRTFAFGRFLVSPERRLQSDITVHVFFEYVNSEWGDLRNGQKPVHLVLGEVCHRWRAIFLSSSELWAELPIERPIDKPLQIIEPYASLVELCISRFGERPMHVEIDTPEYEASVVIVHAALGASKRVMTLTIALTEGNMRGFMGFRGRCFTLLQHLQHSAVF